ncbi:ATP-binding protein [Seonamhaeicola marinus]|uniref:histidine kinase n=1 Tax=Seonamhaeicola marinus TaxID=1912246 RepID=A0A5D0IP05_9FLAO|nr:ATP-binding protein [Seonamhaeicola marinus]TYA84107.1 response regulator [Seonamhaeicola marinus]
MLTRLFFYFLLLPLFLFANEDRDVIKEIDRINTISQNHFNEHRILESFKGFLKSKKLADSISDYYGIAISNFNLAKIHFLMNNHEDAKAYYNNTLEAAKRIDNDYLIANTYLNLAEIYTRGLKFSLAQDYLEKSISFSEEKNYHTSSEIEALSRVALKARINLCKLSLDVGDLEDAYMCLLVSEKYLENITDSYSKSRHNYFFGLYYAKKDLNNYACNKFIEAIKLVDSEEDNYEFLSELYKDLSLAQSKSGNSSKAYSSLLLHNVYKDKLINQEKVRQEIIVKSKYLLEDYKNDIKEANLAKLEQTKIANKLRKEIIAILIMLVLLVLSLTFIGLGYISKKKLTKALKVRNSELEIARNEALKSSELKSKFISNVTHELRTPLYGVVGMTSLLLEKSNLKKKDKKRLKSLKYSGDYLLNLINDILQIGKIEAKEIKLKESSVNLKSLFENIINSFQSRIKETNNKISIEIDKEVPKYIQCDKVRLSQIIFNLFGNSIKFTKNGVISLKVKCLNKTNNNVRLLFEVEDNGIGISKDKFKTIFDVFSQLDESNFEYQGTGLGLAITKNLIELFDSKIEVDSEEGKGTVFRFEIEFAIDLERVDKKEKKTISKSLINQNNYHILVAEDNKINQVVTKNLLRKQNYSCTIVGNGKLAVEEFYKNRDKYDLILMDINMPVMNGNEATEMIYEFDKDIPIIALTAADIEEVKTNFEEIGYKDIIIKPFDNYEFFQIINTQIHKRLQRKANAEALSNAS